MITMNGNVKIINVIVFAALLTAGFVAYSMVETQKQRDTNAVDAAEINKAASTEASSDFIARVGDQDISYSELSTMLNSSAMVGLSVPALGTQERSLVMVTLLDKVISANLLYLDAKQKGTDKLSMYVNDINRFENAILAALYKSNVLIGEIPVTEQEIDNYFKTTLKSDVEFTDDVKLAIESMIRKQKLKEMKSTLRESLRANVDIKINEEALNPDNDDQRADSEIIATINDEMTVVWSDIKELMTGADKRATSAAFYLDNEEERMKRLDTVIDNMIMADKGRKAGLEHDEAFVKRTSEYRKTRLVNIHRSGLIHSWAPSEDELKDYFVDNMDKISIAEARKVQMVVVKTEDEANKIKQQIDDGKITMYQAAQQFSIDPTAKKTLGEMGWVSQGTGFAELDDFTFNLEPETVGGPVKSPAGWHLVKVLDVRDAQLQMFDDPKTQQVTLRSYMKNKLNSYVVQLRKGTFEVAVYDAELQKHFQDEANWIAELNEKAAQEGSITSQRIEDMQKWIGEPQAQ